MSDILNNVDAVEILKRRFQAETATAIITRYLKSIYQKDLTDTEISDLVDGYVSVENFDYDTFLDEVVSGTLWLVLESEAEDIIQNRARVYRVNVRATQEFDIYVKAKNFEDAELFAKELDYPDLSEYLFDNEHEFEVVHTDTFGSDESSIYEEFFDATEDN